MKQEAWIKELPVWACGNYDQFVHKTAADGVWLVQHELDLQEEGENDDREKLNAAQIRQGKKYIAKYLKR